MKRINSFFGDIAIGGNMLTAKYANGELVISGFANAETALSYFNNMPSDSCYPSLSYSTPVGVLAYESRQLVVKDVDKAQEQPKSVDTDGCELNEPTVVEQSFQQAKLVEQDQLLVSLIKLNKVTDILRAVRACGVVDQEQPLWPQYQTLLSQYQPQHKTLRVMGANLPRRIKEILVTFKLEFGLTDAEEATFK